MPFYVDRQKTCGHEEFCDCDVMDEAFLHPPDPMIDASTRDKVAAQLLASIKKPK